MDRSTRVMSFFAVLLLIAAIGAFWIRPAAVDLDPAALRARVCAYAGPLVGGRALTAGDLRGDCLSGDGPSGDGLTLADGARCDVVIIAVDDGRRRVRWTLAAGRRVTGEYLPRGDGPEAMRTPIDLDRDGRSVDLTIFEAGGALSVRCTDGPCRLNRETPAGSACND